MDEQKENTTRVNIISETLKIVAICIFAFGFLGGVALCLYFDIFLVAIISWVATILTGMPFLAYSEIIKLLESVKSK